MTTANVERFYESMSSRQHLANHLNGLQPLTRRTFWPQSKLLRFTWLPHLVASAVDLVVALARPRLPALFAQNVIQS
jgi:hypothetical protein